jgi:O-antigen/teichoic acid export membrane protein
LSKGGVGGVVIILNILKSAWPFALLVGFSAIYNRIDVVIITSMLGFAQTGIYTSAYKFFDLLNFFPASVSHALFPALSGFMAKGKIAEVKITLEKYLRLMIAIALPMAVGGTILSKQLILLVAGQQFIEASRVLSVLIWAIAILFIYIPVNSLVISQLTKKAVAITGINVIINIVGNIILLPIYGIIASAIMTVVSELIQGVFYFYFVRKNITDFAFWSILWKPALASAIMGVMVWHVREVNLLRGVFLGVVSYAVSLYLFKFFKEINFKFY